MVVLPPPGVLNSNVQHALPSLGFFGGTLGDCLDLPLAERISSIEVRIKSIEPEFLNLRGVLVKSGHGILFGEATVEITQSSMRIESQTVPQTPHSLTGIHTLREQAPFWKAEWLVPQQVDRIQIFNRPDHLGIRARSLQVAVTLFDGAVVELYDSTSPTFLVESISRIESIGGELAPLSEAVGAEGCKLWRRQAVHQVAEGLRSNPQSLARPELLSLAALLPTRTPPESKDLSEDDWFLLAYLLCVQVKQDPRTHSGIASFAAVLNSVSRVKKLERSMQIAQKVMDAPEMYLAKHGISLRTLGNESSTGFFEVVEKLIADGIGLGVSVSLAYGTLLGAIREGGPIPHDDDYDFFAPIAADDHNGFVEKRQEFMDALTKLGWHISPNGRYMNFHVRHSDFRNIVLDVFAVHVQGSRAFGHMERAVWREMPAEWFGETRQVSFSSGRLPAIVHAESFLAERYGPNWRNPDKFHEWKWPLAND